MLALCSRNGLVFVNGPTALLSYASAFVTACPNIGCMSWPARRRALRRLNVANPVYLVAPLRSMALCSYRRCVTLATRDAITTRLLFLSIARHSAIQLQIRGWSVVNGSSMS